MNSLRGLKIYSTKPSEILITDHVSSSNLERVISETTKDCELAEKHWNIIAIPGVELTHIPVKAILKIAKEARNKGAKL